MKIAVPIAIRFWDKVQLSEGCWLWTGATNPHGYGLISYKRSRCKLAHRLAWELLRGPIPEGVDVLHDCDNPPCVNPAHLFLGNEQDNVNDMYSKGRQNNVGRRRLSKEHIFEIKARLAEGQRPVDIAPRYSVTQQYVSQLRTFTPRCWYG